MRRRKPWFEIEQEKKSSNWTRNGKKKIRHSQKIILKETKKRRSKFPSLIQQISTK